VKAITGCKEIMVTIWKTHNLKRDSIRWENKWIRTVRILIYSYLLMIIGLKDFPDKFYESDQ
jgi:hypothetical protein